MKQKAKVLKILESSMKNLNNKSLKSYIHFENV